jgi:hypothetical protein
MSTNKNNCETSSTSSNEPVDRSKKPSNQKRKKKDETEEEDPDERCEVCGQPLDKCKCSPILIYFKLPFDEDDDVEEPKKKKLKNSEENEKEKIKITAKDFILNKSNKPIDNLDDFIKILDNPNAKESQKNLILALKELNNLVGMETLKQQIINQILFFIQDLVDSGTFLHSVITGDPGTGKTSVINILAKIYKALGFLKTDKVNKVDRSDLIAEYLGQTAIKTKKALVNATGGILLIDEVYSIGDSNNKDSFSKECIDTINQYLSEHVDDIICIVAGYEDQIEKCFFKQNSGLRRRFPWKFHINKYEPNELCEILFRQLGAWKFDFDRNYILKTLTEKKSYFNGNGGDTRNLLDKCKIIYARRNFREAEKKQINSKIISKEDFDSAMLLFTGIKNKNSLCEHCENLEQSINEIDKCTGCISRKKNSEHMYI